MGWHEFRTRWGTGACALALLLSLGAARAQEPAPATEPQSEQAPGIDIPVIGRVELPGFLARWFGQDTGEGGETQEQADGAGGGQDGEAGQPGGADAPPPAVIVETVETRSVGDSFDFIGTVQPIEQVAIRARVEGYIQEVAFEGGQKVKAGDLLFQIEPAQYQALVSAAQAQLSGAQATLNQAQRDFNRQQELAQSGVSARATLENATAVLENAQASFLQGQAALTQAQLNLGYTRIEAAIDGEISAPLITRGNYVSTASGDLAVLTQMDPIWGVFPIGEGQLVTWQRIGVGETDAAPIAKNGLPGEGGGAAEGASEPQSAQAATSEPQSAQAASSEPQSAQAAPNDPAAQAAPPEPAAQAAPEDEDAPAPEPAPAGETQIASAEGTGAMGAAPPPPGAETVDGAPSTNEADIGDDFDLKLRLPNGASYEPAGQFDFVGNTVNAATGTVEARIAFPNPGGYLLANQNVTLVASEKDPPVLPVVPQAAIQLSREGRAVLLVKPDQTVERRVIQTGKVLGNVTAVTSGLEGGETVVVRGSSAVREGTRVQSTTQAEADAQASQRRDSRQAAGAAQEGASQDGASQGGANQSGASQGGAGDGEGAPGSGTRDEKGAAGSGDGAAAGTQSR